jgi:hypothetical protein
MSGLDRIKRKIKVGVLNAIVAGLLSAPVLADVVEIHAEFVPDPSNPGLNRFKNTTPASGFCALWPTLCVIHKIFSIESNITAQSNAPILANHDLRKGPMFHVPAQWRDVEVVHEDGANSETLQLKISGIGSRYRLSHTAQELIGEPELNNRTALNFLWGGNGNNSIGDWLYPQLPCKRAISLASYDSRSFLFYWLTPEEQACKKTAAYDIPGFSYSKLGFMYELVTPNPLKMKPGIYTGSLRYTVGPMMEFDLGDVMIPSENELVFNFTLKVEHVFKIEIPPGGNKIVMLPEGGWQAWLNQGRRPVRLFRDQTFNIWTSAPFKMSMECEHYAANSTCALQDEKNNQVPVDVSVSLPSGLVDADQQAVNRRRLRVDGVGSERFDPILYIDRKPGTLHFEVGKGAVEEMLQRNSRTYSGDITVIWDSQV